MSKKDEPKCIVCGNPIPDTRGNRAKTCSDECAKERHKEYCRRWYEENKERRKEYCRRWYEENKERKKELSRRWYEENKERHKEYHRRWYEENKERWKEYHRRWYEENKERKKELSRRWYEENKELVFEYNKQRTDEAYKNLSIKTNILIEDLKTFVPPMFVQREFECLEFGSYFLDFVCVVNERAGGKCELTHKKSSNLEVHHLNGYNWCIEGRVDPTNAICIDKSVHKVFHQIYGYGDNTREQWEEFKANYQNKTVTLDNWL